LPTSKLRQLTALPDVVTEFSSGRDLHFTLVNSSGALARDASYQLGLWDLDARSAGNGHDVGNLEIPVQEVGFIRPRGGRGSWRLADLTAAARKVPTGHIVFGAVTVLCSECVKTRTYWVLWKRDETAWYAEMRNDENWGAGMYRVLQAGPGYGPIIDELVPVQRRLRVPE